MRSITEIGNLWPRCKSCNHIAQDHSAVPTPNGDCATSIVGTCPTCNTHGVSRKCDCKGYDGPTLEEFKTLLTPEEIARYNF